MEKYILVQDNSTPYLNKVLKIKHSWCSEIGDGRYVWWIESVNAQPRVLPDWFEEYELKQLKYIELNEKALDLLAFI
jgi:hypothetical protein